jgi:hypothetical protein
MEIAVTPEQYKALRTIGDECMKLGFTKEHFDEARWEAGVVAVLGYHPGRTLGGKPHVLRIVYPDREGLAPLEIPPDFES